MGYTSFHLKGIINRSFDKTKCSWSRDYVGYWYNSDIYSNEIYRFDPIETVKISPLNYSEETLTVAPAVSVDQ